MSGYAYIVSGIFMLVLIANGIPRGLGILFFMVRPARVQHSTLLL